MDTDRSINEGIASVLRSDCSRRSCDYRLIVDRIHSHGDVCSTCGLPITHRESNEINTIVVIRWGIDEAIEEVLYSIDCWDSEGETRCNATASIVDTKSS